MFWSPAVIIFGGPVVNDINMDNVIATAKQFTTMYETLPKIVKSSLGSLGGLYGGLVLLQGKV